MNKFFKSILALGTLACTTSFAEIKITDNFTVEGFVDMSGVWMLDSNDNAAASSMSMSLDQVELDLMYKFSDMVSARADLNDKGNRNAYIEQGYITLTPSKGLNINMGRFLSCSGFETEEPTGLFQYSTSKTLVYGHYQNGASVSFGTDMFSLYGSVVADVWAGNGTGTNMEYPGFEAQLGLMPVKGLTFKVAYLGQTLNDAAVNDFQSLVNAWAMYSAGLLTVAGEFNMLLDWNVGAAEGKNGMGWLGMANANFGKGGVTVRYSGLKIDDIDNYDSEITFAPSLAVSDHLSLIAEYKFEIDAKANNAALEALFVF